MKNLMKTVAMFFAVAVLFSACGPKSDIEGFKKTKSGLHYKFDQENPGAQKAEMGDVLVVEMKMKMDDSLLFSNEGTPQRMFQVSDPIFSGDVNEGLLMLHIGDVATFAVESDSMANYFPMPPFYKQGVGSKIYYEIKLNSIVNKVDIDKEKAEFEARMEKAREEEPDLIKQYVAVNQITQQPTRSGLYIIEKKKGNGPMVEQGKAVKVNYTGKLLDGKVFDTSVKSVAQEAGIYNPARNYEPLSYVVGEMSLIQAWEQAMSTLRQGSVATIIMPSALGYGARGSQEIPPYSPLVFELEVVSVK
jgi:FKBP-type peptidyl-prolyl cis-trans isomerase